MALTLCTIDSKSLQKTGGQAIGSDNINLTITPDQHHSVTASDFSVGPHDNSKVSAVTITDNGVPGSFANTLNVLVDLKDTFEMPASNTTITVDVDGSAIKGERILQAIHLTEVEPIKSAVNVTITTTAGTGITLSGQTTVGDNKHRTVTGSKQQATRVLLFTKLFQASTGYYFPVEPDYNVTSAIREHPELYEVEIQRTYLDDGSVNLPLQVIEFKVFYNVPSYDVIAGDSDTITFAATSHQLFSPNREISNVTFDPTNIGQRGGTKIINVYGVPGAAYNIGITSADTHLALNPAFYNNQVIPAKGYQSHLFTFYSSFVGNTYTNITYGINITAASSTPATTVNYTNIPNSVPNYTLTQFKAVVLTLARTTPSGLTFSPTSGTNATITAMPGYVSGDLNEQISNFDYSFNITKTAGGNVFVRRQPLYNEIDQSLSDFSNSVFTSNTGYLLNLSTIEATGSGTATVAVSVKGDADIGTTDKSMVLNINNIINIPPTTTASSFTANTSGATTHGLTASDANGDPLTYATVTAPTKGSLSISSNGVATYTRTVGASGNDSFRFKVNDTYEDSNTSLVTITAGSSELFSVNVVYKYRDSSSSSPNTEYNLAGVFSGTETLQNFVAGSSSNITIIVSNWNVDQVHAGVPTYMNQVNDFDDIEFRIKNNSGNVISNGSGQIPINLSTSSFNNTARTGTVNSNIASTSANSLATEPHTLEIILVYKDNPNP